MAWDKTKPAGNTPLNASDDLIRQNWAALEDALARDHNFPGTEGTNAGEHKKITLREQAEKPPVGDGKHVLYAKSDGIYIEKSDGTEIKIFNFATNKLTEAESADSATSSGTVTQMVNNADKVDGFDASQTRTPNTIPVSDADGWLNSWIKQGEGSELDADKIRGLPGDFTCSYSDNGYTKLPNGIIFQWGHGQIDKNSSLTVNFNIPFPNLCFGVFVTPINASGTGGGSEDYWGLSGTATTTSFTLLNWYNIGQEFYWLAVGY